MFKNFSRTSWICPRCRTRQALTGCRSFLTQATTPVTPGAVPLSSQKSTAKDDETLRKVFDSPPFWKDFSTRSSAHRNGIQSGLLQNKYLKDPQGFQDFSRDALKNCQKIVDTISAATTTDEYRLVVRLLDRLSDQLCRVIDLVDFIRNVHPDQRIQHAATFAHGRMFEYMNVLNTTKILHDQLEKACSIQDVTSQWTEEEKVTAQILLEDFKRSGVSAPEREKNRFVELSNDVVECGTELNERMAPERMSIEFPSSRLKGMDPIAIKRRTSWGTTTLPTFGPEAQLALNTVHDADARRDVYLAMRRASGSSIDTVESLAKARAELARLARHDSYGHLTLSDKMSKSPEAVNGFLRALAAENKSHATSDITEMLELKRADANADNFPGQLNAWDRDYYSTRLRSRIFAENRMSESLSQYFSVGTVMQGLSRLFNRLYGVSLVPRETLPGETWNEDVRCLDVVDERDGHIAVIYCDLFKRPNKSPNPAHFTLRCSREISSSEINEAVAKGALSSAPALTELADTLNDGMALNVDLTNHTVKQLPTIGFICDFPRSSTSRSSSTPALLTLRQFTTLFHEMGHCLHSILGRTSLQNVSGTRCATDFAELPSILMEHFAADPDVLGLYARHWETDAPLDARLVSEELEKSRRLRAAAETENQIILSVLDQKLHGPDVPPLNGDNARWSSTEMYQQVHNDPTFASIPEPNGTAWQGFFGHLYQYGAVYYSYLFDRAIAAKLFGDVFSAGRALDREQGELYKKAVLRWGGGRDPWRCVADVLGGEKRGYGWLSAGGEDAMQEVGRWGAGGLGDSVGI